MADIVATESEADSMDRQGMRPMQRKAFQMRNAQHLLIKAPPASGKSRCLMFIALEKIRQRDVSKVIVAVPEVSIGASFRSINLTTNGFHSDWVLNDRWNLCSDKSDRKVDSVDEFLRSDDTVLVCTHATLRGAVAKYGVERFDGCLVAIDEFHHVSESEDSKLGEVCRSFVKRGGIQVIAMTGSYFRGDRANILPRDIEEQFTRVTYSYYEQLASNKHLKRLEIREAFYIKDFFTVLHEALNVELKTIVHIPSVNSAASTKDKLKEVGRVIETVGEIVGDGAAPGIYLVESRATGRLLNVVDLVSDDRSRQKTLESLRDPDVLSTIDIIIALNLAKEGFDWPACEHALTIGYRGSLTEVIQIIGRATRDHEGKTTARFTQLVAKPTADMSDVVEAVNDMLKSVACALLMEMAYAKPLRFSTKCSSENKGDDKGEATKTEDGASETAKPTASTVETVNPLEGIQTTVLGVAGLRNTGSNRVGPIIANDMLELQASILRNEEIGRHLASNRPQDIRRVNKTLIPRVIAEKYPELGEQEVEEVSQHLLADLILRRQGVLVKIAGKQVVKLPSQTVDLDDLSVDLIESVNPFLDAYDIISKKFDSETLSAIQGAINADRDKALSTVEMIAAVTEVKAFFEEMGRKPDRNSYNPEEAKLGKLHDRLVQERIRLQEKVK